MCTRSLYSFSSIVLLLLLFPLTCCRAQGNSLCVPSSCGNIKNITFPFRLKDAPGNCGNPNFELECQNNQTILYLNSRSYYVKSIDYAIYTIRVADSALEINDLCSFPLNSTEDITSSDIYRGSDLDVPLVLVQCPKPVNSSRYVDVTYCRNRNSGVPPNISQIHSYIVVGNELTLSELEESCSVERVIRASTSPKTERISLSSIHEAFTYGIELSWIEPLCGGCYGHGECTLESNSVVCRPYSVCYEHEPLSVLPFRCALLYWAPFIIVYGGIGIAAVLGLRFLCGISCLIPFLVHKWSRRKKLPEYECIDPFDEQTNFKPIRYSYSEIKKMTNNFKERLGSGSYGTLFKGRLRSGPPIAVKMMHKPMSSAQEFVNVVAALGKIHHGNVLQLLGFCFEGEKRALVYDLMPSGSLRQYINVTTGESFSLSYEKMFEISLEVARGIDHLHQKFDLQGLHLGIKPHNVLLDENSRPKISDFGLVRLYPAVGYNAPEFYYKNLGEVSYKADVYSYGVLLMEMVGKVKSVAKTISPVHFSEWVYDLQNEGQGMEIIKANAEEMKMLKKMIIVALWCIQMLPVDRPPMNKVVEMLEGDPELLKMPPKPFLAPKGLVEDHGTNR